MTMVPFMLVVVSTLLGMMFFPKPSHKLIITIVVALALTHTVYVLFRIFCTLELRGFANAFWSIVALVFELFIYLTSLALYMQLLFSTNRKAQADIYEQDVVQGRFCPWVDVFIPTYSEPKDMLRRSIAACQGMDYEKKRVYILDDGRRPEIAELAREMGCEYIIRPDNKHAKAGNVNHALQKTNGDFIAMFDADCVPQENFLKRIVGFFQEQDTGLVISSQSYYNMDMFSHNMVSLTEKSCLFRICQRGRDYFNALLCFGTCFIVRRTAMEDIGGIPTETICEDWATSIKIQAYGYKTCSLDEILGASAVAESMGEFIQQRIRWTQGTLQSLFSSTNPLTIKGLTFFQRLIHSYSILHYLTTPFFILIIVFPFLYFMSGFVPFNVSAGQFWIFFMPFIFLNIVAFSWIAGEYTAKFTSLIAESFMCVPITMAVIKTLIWPYGWRFRVTEKGVYRKKTTANWILMWPQVVFLVLIAFGILYGYEHMHWYGAVGLYYFLFYICLVRLVLLVMGMYASCDFPQQRREVRFQKDLQCSVSGESCFEGTTVDISEGGVLIRAELPSFDLPQTRGLINIPEFNLTQVPVRFVRKGGQCIAALFDNLTLENYRLLIKSLYCRPGQWDKEYHLDRKIFKAIIKALTLQDLFTDREKTEEVAFLGLDQIRFPLNLLRVFFLSMVFIFTFSAKANAQEISDAFKTVNDVYLKDLISEMMANNHDLKAMVDTISEVQSQYALSRSALYPSVNFDAVAGVHHLGVETVNIGQDNFELTVPVSYELDVWGRLQDKSDSAFLETQAAGADRDALSMTLVAELLQRYYAALCMHQQMRSLNNNILLAGQRYQLLRYQFENDTVSKDEVFHSQQLLQELISKSIVLERQYSRVKYGIKILIGRTPESSWLEGDFNLPAWLLNIRKDISDDDLDNRPDIKSLQLKIDAAGYDAKSIKKEALPKFTFLGDVDNSSNNLDKLTYGDRNSWGAFFKMSVPIFDGGANKASHDEQLFRQRVLMDKYRQALLSAQSEVESALNNGTQQNKIIESIQQKIEFNKEEIRILELQYKEGEIDSLHVIDSKQNLADSEMELSGAQLALIADRIQLLRALGKSWW